MQQLRSQGKTYGEIKKITGVDFPKSTLYELCKNTPLPAHYPQKIANINLSNLQKAREYAAKVNRFRRDEFLKRIENINLPISSKIHNRETAKIALSMLCLGEASKYKTGSVFSLGNSDPRIVILFLRLLKTCFDFKPEKIRCTVQCRADQNTDDLEKFWMKTTQIPRNQFYKTRIDSRTLGKPTKKKGYKGVLKVDYLDRKAQLELESLADLIYNRVR